MKKGGFSQSNVNRYLNSRSSRKPSLFRRIFRSKKVKKAPGQVVVNEKGQPKLCYPDISPRSIRPTGADNCNKGEFCNRNAPGGGPLFCYYNFSKTQIKKGKKQAKEFNNYMATKNTTRLISGKPKKRKSRKFRKLRKRKLRK